MKPEIMYDDTGKLYLRKSMVESFNFCPRQFKNVYIDGNFVNETYIMQIGTRFHDFAYWFFDVCESIPVDRWTELVPSAFNVEEREWAHWWITTEQERYRSCEGRRFQPAQREMKLVDDTMLLTGTLDRIDYGDNEDELVIVEYKTGKSYHEESIIRQLSFYKLMWDNTIKLGEIKYMKYINPRTQVIKMIPINPSMTDKVLMSISKVRKAIREENYPCKCSPVKHIICGMCDFDECGIYGT